MSSASPSSSSTNQPSSSPSPTTTPTTSTSASSTTTTNAATTSQSSSSSTTTSASSTVTSTQSSSTTSTTSSSASVVQIPTTSAGQVETFTSIIVPSSIPTSTPQSTSTSSNSFFANKGAVAGVFSVVGLVVVALIIALVVNAIRRRRAQKFDRDVAEAAAEAAASSRSPFDDYSYGNTGAKGGGGGGYGYSENSHENYQLPPLQPHHDPYGMSEMSQYDPYAAGAASLAAAAVGRSRSRKDSEPGIAGVGAGTLAREPSKRAPYHAFAGPTGPPQHDLQASNGTIRSIRGTNQDVLEAAGLVGPGIASMAGSGHNNSAGSAFITRKPSEVTQNTHLSGRSQFGSMNSGHHPTPLQPGYPVDSYYPQRNDNLSPDPFATYPPVQTVSKPLPNPHDATLPSPPLAGPQSDHTEELAEMGSQTALRSEENRMSYQDDADYSQSHRVLRVANE